MQLNHAEIIGTYLKRANLTQKEFAKRIGVSQTTVWYWSTGKLRVTPDRAKQIESVTNGEITRKDLYQELFSTDSLERQALNTKHNTRKRR